MQEKLDTTQQEDDIAATLRNLFEEFVALREEFRNSVRGSDQQRVLFDRLHEENEQLRRAELDRARDPVVRDLILLTDTCLRNGRSWLKRTEVTPDDIDRVLREVAEDVDLILARQGVEGFEPERGTTFDRREARAVQSVSTTDKTLDGTVAEVLRRGYRMGDRVLRYCEVVVYAYEQAPDYTDIAENTERTAEL